MPIPQTPDAMAAAIESMASRRLGPGPAAAAPADPAAAMAAAQGGAPQQAPQAPARETAEGAANTKGAPNDEAAAMAENAIAYDVDWGEGRKRKLTPEAIRSTYDRYGKLNALHGQLRPVIDAAVEMLAANPGMSAAQLVNTVRGASQIARQQEPNQQFGDRNDQSPNREPNRPQQSNEDIFAAWEKENAAKLPPGYREMMGALQTMGGGMGQMQQMMRQVLAGSQGVADAARQSHGQARQGQMDTVKRTIANNLDRAQAALGLDDGVSNDFGVWMGERGYTLEDFADPELTLRVMADFRNTLNSPEMERLRGIAQRRQAFIGSMGSSPAGGGAGGMPAQGGSPLDRMVNSAMSKRGA